MRVVYKYQLNGDISSVDLPIGSKVVKFGVQRGIFQIWVDLDDEETTRYPRHFQVFGTGWTNIPSIAEHIETIFDDDEYVWHLYEVLEGPA